MSFAVEDQLLIQCSRVKLDDEAITAASNLLQQELDWDYILEASIKHGVSPLFYYGLNQVSQVIALDQFVPAGVMARLQKLYKGNQSRNRRLFRVIGDVFKAFDRVGIQAMGLKDVHLTRLVYPDIGLRPMGDIDILIHREDYDKVAACLADLGFVPLPDPNIPFTLKYAWAHHFHREADNIWLDVQWNVLQKEWDTYQEGNFDFEIERMWRGAAPMTVDDYHILAPAPEDVLFHLCLHLEGHAYAELILFCDIVELLRYHDCQLDWRYFVGISKKYRVESSVYYVLSLVQHLFKVSLPTFLLQELEPAYFKANLFKPLFGNLTTLHLSLDQIRLAAASPDEVMAEFERVVRQQAVGAMQAYKSLDDLASRFIETGGDVVVLSGTHSEKVLPDPSLKPFEEIHCFILNQSLTHMRQALSGCGFTPMDEPNAETYVKQWKVTSVDPVLADRLPTMVLQADIQTRLDDLFQPREGNGVSKKNVALKLLKTKLGHHQNGNDKIPVHIKIIALSPEDMLFYLSAQLGKQRQNRLFGLCSLLEFFRGYPAPLNWEQVTSMAQRYGVSHWVGEGLLMAKEVVGDDQIPSSAFTSLLSSDLRPRMLGWARYGPVSLDLYTGFKRTFFYLFSLLSLEGGKAKFKYLLQSLFGHHGSKPMLPGLMLELMASTFSMLRKKRPAITDFVYWIEPESALETELTDR